MFSFRARKQQVDIAGYLRRICDCTTPNNGLTEHCDRAQNRYNRSIPVLIWPWIDNFPVADYCLTAVTKDVNDHGIGLLLNSPLRNTDIVVGMLSDQTDRAEAWFFRGEVVRGKSLGAGYWLFGARLLEFLNRDHPEAIEHLLDQVAQLHPV